MIISLLYIGTGFLFYQLFMSPERGTQMNEEEALPITSTQKAEAASV